MKYVSKDSSFPTPSPTNGFWVKDDKIFDVTTSSHVRFMIENVSLFNFTAKQVLAVYKKYHEVVGTEAEARKELIRLAVSQGWVRIRHYTKPKDYLSIQTDDTKRRRDTIVSFIRWGLENGIVQQNDSAVIIGFADSRDRHEYEYKDGGVASYLLEEQLHDA